LPDAALAQPLVLASASPRRAALLRQVGIDFEVQVSDVAEEADRPGAEPAEVAGTHARQKALDVAGDRPDRLVLGADADAANQGRWDDALREAEARGVPLLFLPYLIGASSPWHRPSARACLLGLRPEDGPADLLFAAMQVAGK
jgi:hypothetical protein